MWYGTEAAAGTADNLHPAFRVILNLGLKGLKLFDLRQPTRRERPIGHLVWILGVKSEL